MGAGAAQRPGATVCRAARARFGRAAIAQLGESQTEDLKASGSIRGESRHFSFAFHALVPTLLLGMRTSEENHWST